MNNANLKALVQKWRRDSDACLKDKSAMSSSEHYHTQGEGFSLGECADELAREIQRMESEPLSGARTAETPETGALRAELEKLRAEFAEYKSKTDAFRAPVNRGNEIARLIEEAGSIIHPINQRAAQEELPPAGMKFDAQDGDK